jgi:hypothetical protein
MRAESDWVTAGVADVAIASKVDSLARDQGIGIEF